MESNINGRHEQTRYERKDGIKKQSKRMLGRKKGNKHNGKNKERMNEKAESGFSWLSKDPMAER
jgi:hypothetical protein